MVLVVRLRLPRWSCYPRPSSGLHDGPDRRCATAAPRREPQHRHRAQLTRWRMTERGGKAGADEAMRRPVVEQDGDATRWALHGREEAPQLRLEVGMEPLPWAELSLPAPQASPEVCGQSSQRVVNPVGSQWPNAAVRSLSAVWPSHASWLAPTRPKLRGRGVVPCDGSHAVQTRAAAGACRAAGRLEGATTPSWSPAGPVVGGSSLPPARPGLSKSPRMHLVKRSCPASSRHRPGRAPHPPATMRGPSVIACRPPHGAADLPPP